MRVNCKKSFSILKSLRLDQSSFGLARQLLCLTEHYETLRESITFLERCKHSGLIPNYIQHCIRRPANLGFSRPLSKLLSRTQASLLNFSIRHKLSQLTTCKQKLADARTRLSPQIYSRLETAIETASSSTKISKETILKKKFEKLQQRRTPSLF